MKKNILRVIALVLVAGMLFSFAACKQEVLIRFVDAQGNDLDLSSIGGGSGNVAPAPTEAPTAAPTEAPTQGETPTEAPTAAPTEAPTQGNAPTEAPTAAPTEAPTEAAKPTSGKPSTTQEIADFYKKAVTEMKNTGNGGYTKKEWQVLDEINVGPSIINNAVKSLAGSFMTTEDKAEAQVCAKGSDDAKGRFPGFTLSDYSKIASATCEEAGGKYNIKIVMVDEDTPKKDGSLLGQVTNSVLYWEDIDDTLKNDSTVNKVIKSYDGIHVNYQGFLIEAVMTPDGHFESMKHTANVGIVIGSAKLVVGSIENKSGHLVNYCTYSDFNY